MTKVTRVEEAAYPDLRLQLRNLERQQIAAWSFNLTFRGIFSDQHRVHRRGVDLESAKRSTLVAKILKIQENGYLQFSIDHRHTFAVV